MIEKCTFPAGSHLAPHNPAPKNIDERLTMNSHIKNMKVLLASSVALLLAGCGGGGGSGDEGDKASGTDTGPKFSLSVKQNGLVGGFWLDVNGETTVATEAGDPSTPGVTLLSTRLSDRTGYTVKPINDASTSGQICSVGNARGVVNGANITNVTLNCGPKASLLAYATNQDQNSISLYYIDVGTGALTGNHFDAASRLLVSNGTTTTGNKPTAITIDPTGQFVYVTNRGDDQVAAFSINNTDPNVMTGKLTLIGTAPTASLPSAVTVSPSGKFAYVANGGSGSVSAYSIDTSMGGLTPIATVPAGDAPQSVTVHPTGKFAYVANAGKTNNVSVYAINTAKGSLTQVTTVTAGTAPWSVAVSPSGTYAYVVNAGSDSVSIFKINSTTGDLSPVGTAATGVNPLSIALDPNGQFAYVANVGSNSVSAYSIDSSTGLLTQVGNAATGSQPVSVTIDRSGRLVYTANESSSTVSAFKINMSSGALSLAVPASSMTTSNIATGARPSSIATTTGCTLAPLVTGIPRRCKRAGE
jgi:6-phosphogluconolactonase